MMMWW